MSEPESESTSVPDVGQSNGVDSTNGPDPNALVGLDALLQVLQGANTNTSNDVSTPSSDRVDFPRSPAQVSENAVQVAATALSQLSQQEAPDTHYPFVGMIDTVRPSSQRFLWSFLCNVLHINSSVVSGLRRHCPVNSNATFRTRRSQLSCSLTTSIDPLLTGYFPSSIGHVLRTAIARSHRAHCRRLSSLSPCWPLLARLPCSSCQKLMKTYVPHSFSQKHLYPRKNSLRYSSIMYREERSWKSA